MSSLESNDTFVELIIKDPNSLSNDPYADVVQAVVDRVQLKTSNLGEGVVRVCRGDYTDVFVGPYCIREDASGNTIGLFKLVDDRLEQIGLAFKNEFRLITGSGVDAPSVPKGWELVTDSQIVNKYNIGTPPNWIVAAIKYVGI